MADPKGSRPVFNVLAGPNGSGKSTLAALLSSEGHSLGPMINPDDIAVGLRKAGYSGNVDAAAGRETMKQTRAHIKNKTSFARETTLSSREILRTMNAAKAAGFEVNLIFVAVQSLGLNKLRVQDRAKLGGHDIPIDAQDRRFGKIMANVPKAIKIAHSTKLFDNSGVRSILVGLVDKQRVTFAYPQKAAWLNTALKGIDRAPHSRAATPEKSPPTLDKGPKR